MKIAIAADHAGFTLKETLRQHLISQGHQVVDFGCDSTESVDYPDFAAKVAEAVSEQQAERGVLVCGSGIGMCMAANRFGGVRAAVLRSFDDARLSRLHNDSNVACLGGRVTATAQAKELLETFLKTPFEGGRHQKRIQKIHGWDKP